ncbi:MAG: hypothetical protein IKH44_02925 [Bacteroidales bacterium]|nr:hypothetical protein [Bacteroidales bacterium]
MENILNNTDAFDIKIRVPEIEIDEKNPFLNDKLKRDNDVITMTRIVEAFQNGGVLSLNGAWGSGKTIFLKIWKQYLSNKGIPVAYYNAWEDDISEEPLFSMIKSLKSVSKDESSFDVFVEKAGKFIVGALFGAVKSVAGFGGKVAADAVKGGVDQIEKDCIESLKSKDNTTTLLNGFKDSLSEYVTDIASKGYNIPLVYFVDELDRCNPTFAVKVLERIKHLFEVKNVVFVLSIDKRQLCHSINGYFGSEAFDSEEYLMRFIDIEYSISSFVTEDFCSHLLKEQFHLDRTLTDKAANKLIGYIGTFTSCFNLTCRQTEKVFSLFTVALYRVDDKPFDSTTIKDFNLELLFYLACLKIYNQEVFNKIAERIYSVQELVDALEKMHNDFNRYKRYEGADGKHIIRTLSLLICLYDEYIIDSDAISEGHLRPTFNVLPSKSMLKYIDDFSEKAYSCSWDLYPYIEKLRLNNEYEKMQYLTEEIKSTLNRLDVIQPEHKTKK